MTLRDFPQRLNFLAPPGSRLKRVLDIGRRLNQRKALRQAAERDPVDLAEVRQCPCLKCLQDPAGEAAHVRMQSAAHGKTGGIGKKPADRWTIPLCATHHREGNDALHRVGELQFFYDLGISPFRVCQKLYAARGDLTRMRAVVFAAVAERDGGAK